jgi:hypothetical protein
MVNRGHGNSNHQISYSKGSRLAGDPGASGKLVPNRTSQHGSRNVRQVEQLHEEIQPDVASCLSITKSGSPCKARPAEGESFCTFHKE